MTRVSVFSSPLLLGFDHIERVLDRVNKTAAEGYPPYNIEQLGEHRLRITLAVAGFAESDLSVNVEDNQLVITAASARKTSATGFLSTGAARRRPAVHACFRSGRGYRGEGRRNDQRTFAHRS